MSSAAKGTIESCRGLTITTSCARSLSPPRESRGGTEGETTANMKVFSAPCASAANCCSPFGTKTQVTASESFCVKCACRTSPKVIRVIIWEVGWVRDYTHQRESSSSAPSAAAPAPLSPINICARLLRIWLIIRASKLGCDLLAAEPTLVGKQNIYLTHFPLLEWSLGWVHTLLKVQGRVAPEVLGFISAMTSSLCKCVQLTPIWLQEKQINSYGKRRGKTGESLQSQETNWDALIT